MMLTTVCRLCGRSIGGPERGRRPIVGVDQSAHLAAAGEDRVCAARTAGRQASLPIPRAAPAGTCGVVPWRAILAASAGFKKPRGMDGGGMLLGVAAGSMLAICIDMATIDAANAADVDVQALFAKAQRDGRVGAARKTKPVDVRPAQARGDSRHRDRRRGQGNAEPAGKPGDMVVRNRCPATGNEEILVSAAKFAQRYEGPVGMPARTAGCPIGHGRGNALSHPGRRRRAVQLHRTLGRGHGRQAGRRDRPGPEQPQTPTASPPRRSPAPMRSPGRQAAERWLPCRRRRSADGGDPGADRRAGPAALRKHAMRRRARAAPRSATGSGMKATRKSHSCAMPTLPAPRCHAAAPLRAGGGGATSRRPSSTCMAAAG